MATNIITPKFIERMRSSDYQGTSYAFAEIIDNSFDAESNLVRITAIEKRDPQNRRVIDEIIFSDNGYGMDFNTLNHCLTFAYGTNDNIDDVMKKKKIGKFGMGLPNASISQCKKIAVYSKQISDDWHLKTMDIESLVNNDSTNLDDAITTSLPEHLYNVNAVIDIDKGTIVSWKECDRLDRQYADTLFKRSEGILGRVFRHYLAKGCKLELAIYLHNEIDNSYIMQSINSITLNDPLFLTPNAYITKALRNSSARDEALEEKYDPSVYYGKFVNGLSENESRPTNNKYEDYSFIHSFEWKGKTYYFRFKSSYANIDIQKPGIREGGKTKVGAVYGDKMKNGNIYFTRHQREISSGHYGFYNLSAENNRWWTIEIDFDPEADDLLGVSNTKQGIKFNKTIDDESSLGFDKHTASLQQAKEKLWFEISSKITKAITALTKILAAQAKQFEDFVNQDEGEKGSPLPSGTAATTQAIKNTDKQRPGTFDIEQKLDLINALKEKFKNLSEENIEYAVDKFDKSLVRGCIIYCPIEGSDQLWSYTEIRGFLVISINTNHDFYNNIIASFRQTKFESALTAIELFISSLAWEQNMHFDNDKEKQRNLDNFRTYVGIHLNNYLQENDIKVTVEDLENFQNETS